MPATDPMRLHAGKARRLSSGGKMESQAAGRVCTEPTCRTILSRYNPAQHCSAHAGWDADTAPARRRRRPTA